MVKIGRPTLQQPWPNTTTQFTRNQNMLHCILSAMLHFSCTFPALHFFVFLHVPAVLVNVVLFLHCNFWFPALQLLFSCTAISVFLHCYFSATFGFVFAKHPGKSTRPSGPAPVKKGSACLRTQSHKAAWHMASPNLDLPRPRL